MSSFTPTERTQVKRLPKRGAYDRETVFKILDEGFVCHVGFVVDGQPYVIPTNYGRNGDTLYLHGSAASRMLRTLSEGIPVCMTVTLIDGLVLARSAFHHSVNYRSVVVLGNARPLRDRDEQHAALETLVEHIAPGRSADARGPSDQELEVTEVIAIPIHEASAKIRTGPPVDAPDDYRLPLWAGELPLQLTVGEPRGDARCSAPVPDYVRHYHRGH